jgi:putative addiction module component (TIGR02574 family)
MVAKVSSRKQRVLSLASGLSSLERVEVAAELLGGLDRSRSEVAGKAWERAWGDEIARRLERLDGGEVQAIPWPEVRAQLNATLRAARRRTR